MTEPNPAPSATRDDEPRKAAKRLRLFRYSVTLAGFGLVTGLIGGLFWLRMRDQVSDALFIGLTVGGALIALAATLLNYLGDDYRDATVRVMRILYGVATPTYRDLSLRSSRYMRERDYWMLMNRVYPAESKSQPAVQLTEKDRQTVVSAVADSVRSEVSEQLLQSIETKYGENISRSSQLLELRTLADRTRERLLDEVSALSKRSNLNLVIGIVTTAVAVGLLGYIVLSSPLSVADWRGLIPTYALRLSLVVFIEIFAFFFLRMYRVNLQEIKYFQNELTSIEAKLIALEAAMRADDPDGVRAMTALLGSVERNLLLQQGQSTVELERLRLENGTLKGVLEFAARFVPGSDAKERK